MKNAKAENLLHLVLLTSNLPLHIFNFGMFLTQRDCTVSEDTSLFAFQGRKNVILAWKDMSVIYNTRIFLFLEHLLFSKVQRVLLQFHSFTWVADNEVREMFADVPPRVSEGIGTPQGH